MKSAYIPVLAVFLLTGGLMTEGRVQAGLVTISISNPGNSSFSLTPLWYGFHDGGHDIFDPGQAATASLEMLAEDGIIGGLQTDFLATSPTGQQGVLTAPGGFPGAPVIEPGETASFTFHRHLANRFLSFASMIIPSNDAFIGTAQAIEIFNADGSLVGGGNKRTLTISYGQIWDAGTEINNTLGAAFSTVGGISTDENGVVGLLPAGGLDNFLNTFTPAGQISSLFTPGSTVATVTITSVPEPSTGMLVGIAFVSLATLRKRKSVKAV